jgi:lysophospholipase L1-like esterase
LEENLLSFSARVRRLAGRLSPRQRRWGARALKVLFPLALIEVLLRIALALVVRPGCGVQPELLGRLMYAYARPRTEPGMPDPDGMVPDAHRGHRHAAALRGMVLQGVAVSTNSRGARGEREYAVPKPPGVVRVVALGDSFTFGYGVTDDATWPAQLERALGTVEVVNLGERAYAHDQMYFALHDDGLAFSPDAVILGFFPNDVWRNELTFYCFEKPRFSLGPDGWRIENVPVPAPVEVIDRYRRMPLLYAAARVLVERAETTYVTPDDGALRATEILRRIRQLAADAGARFLMVDLPEHFDDPLPARDFFHRFCATSGVECIDTLPLFRAMAPGDNAAALHARYVLPADTHYSRAGYAVVAEALRRYLAEHPLAPRGASP